MREVLVREIYTVDTISKGNFKAWLKLMDFIKNEIKPDEDVMFDFKGIEVIQPWATNEFKQFMQDERVHIKLWSSEGTVNSINIMCTLGDSSSGRAVNEQVAVEKKLSKEELQIIAMANELQKYFEVDENDKTVATLNVGKRFDQVGVPITVDYIREALMKFAKEHEVKRLRLNVVGIIIQASVIKNITNVISALEKEGIKLEILSNDEEVKNKIGMYQSLEGNDVSTENDKLRVIKAQLKPGKVGMLIKYKESKAVDEFGRRGKGKPLNCRVAIYNGLKRGKDGIIRLKFTTFNGNTFFTSAHWRLEHDNDELDNGPEHEELSISVKEFGMYNEFLGSKYHFITPVQIKPEHSMTMYGLDQSGKVTHTKMTIPERIKAVLDDWGYKYDNESLQSYIQKTREVLG